MWDLPLLRKVKPFDAVNQLIMMFHDCLIRNYFFKKRKEMSTDLRVTRIAAPPSPMQRLSKTKAAEAKEQDLPPNSQSWYSETQQMKNYTSAPSTSLTDTGNSGDEAFLSSTVHMIPQVWCLIPLVTKSTLSHLSLTALVIARK